VNREILNEAELLQDKLRSWRRQLHQMPETGLQLPKTASFVKEKLREMGITGREFPGCSCITAVLGKGSRCFLLRSDMDALPMQEESGEPFASHNGCMHACGHDLHTSILLGAAEILKHHESELKGQVKLLFQPGEETFEGARMAVSAGILENPHVDAAFAMHVSSIMPLNMIIYGSIPMASVYGFKITLTGKGSHGSMPQLGIDPINTGVHIYLALQELISREVSPAQEAVLTIGHFDAGKVANVIPERAVLEGTLRTFKSDVRERLIGRVHGTAENIARAYRTGINFEILSDVPAVVCDDDLNSRLTDSIRNLDNSVQVLPKFHAMGSEDFAFISQKVPSSYFCIGAGLQDSTQWVGHHNPMVRFNEECLPLGAAIYAKAAMDWLNSQG
jgi:amidohydrolase